MKLKQLLVLAIFLLGFIFIALAAGSWNTGGIRYTRQKTTQGDTDHAQIVISENRTDAILGASPYTGGATTFDGTVANIGSTAVSLRVPPGTWPISANLTVPANITLKPDRGAVLAIATGTTLTINGTLDAGLYQIFSCTGTGTVVFGAGTVTEVYPQWWGLPTDGSDGTTAFTAAAICAATAGAPLKLPDNCTIRLSPSSTIDLSGIPELRGQNVTVDVSGASCYYIFTVTGSKTLIGGPEALASGATAVTVTAGSYSRGDTIFITADEATPNTYRDYYRKGGRHYIDTYSGGTSLGIYPPTDFSYINAYIWRVTEARFKIGRGITFIGDPTTQHTCLSLRYANAHISANFLYFTNSAVSYNDSTGIFDGSSRAMYLAGGASAVGVAINDLSEVAVNGGRIEGGRHAVALGGGNWNANEMGGANKQIAFPASATINGGFYKANLASAVQAINAHGCANSLVVNGANVVGGIDSGARYTEITGCDIAFRNCSGLKIDDCNSLDWGNFLFSDNLVHALGQTNSTLAVSFISMNSDNKCNTARFSGNTFLKPDSDNTDIYVGGMGGGGIRRIVFANNDFSLSAAGASMPWIYLDVYYQLDWLDNTCTNIGLQVTPKLPEVNANFRGGGILSPQGHGIVFVNENGHGFDTLDIDGIQVKGSKYNGLDIKSAFYHLNVRNLTARDNNTAKAANYGGIYILAKGCTRSIQLLNNDLQDDQATPTQDKGFYLGETYPAACTVTADPATDILTVGSVFPTGTPVQLTTTGTLPAGLSLATTYYCIYLSSTTLKLAATFGAARTSTAIDITNAGSGTHTITKYNDATVNAKVHLVNNCAEGCTSGNLVDTNHLFYIASQTGNRGAGTPLPDMVLGSDGNRYKFNGSGWVSFP